ncbi:MAG TPA: hypothetical protein VGK59_23330 [Ohtaekwangia sp.]
MKKFLTLILIVVLACLLGGIYGILHDQITYSISPEYYTKFKFYQFGLQDGGNEAIFPAPRIEVSIVGFMAVWWMGIPIGLVLGLVGMNHPDWKTMLIITLKSFLITLLIAFVTGLLGLAYGMLVLSEKPQHEFTGWFIPENLVDFKNFIAVGSMHNMSYLGGIIGLGGGIIYSVRQMQLKPEGLLGKLLYHSLLFNGRKKP